MQYKQIKCNSIINKITNKDTIFNGSYTVDMYQNCEFGCKYCDSSIGNIVYIKTNAVDIFKEQIKAIDKGRIIIGSVHDPYQKLEEKYKLTRNILKIIEKNDLSCHILTKSNLVLRDIDILSKIKDCYVTLSIISLNESIYNKFEENVISSFDRLKVIKTLSEENINSGLAIIPILPYIVELELKDIVKISKKNKAKYVLHKYLELKGDQKNIYLDIIRKINPKLISNYQELYGISYKPNSFYIRKLNSTVKELCEKYKIKNNKIY
jgi:DNA repair photolyase